MRNPEKQPHRIVMLEAPALAPQPEESARKLPVVREDDLTAEFLHQAAGKVSKVRWLLPVSLRHAVLLPLPVPMPKRLSFLSPLQAKPAEVIPPVASHRTG